MGDIILIFTLLSILFRGKLFKDRDIKYRWTFMPFYNKVILGKLSESKKLGIATATSSFITTMLLGICVYVEYSIWTMLPQGEIDISVFKVEDYVPQAYITANDVLKILLLIVAAVYFIAWVALMYKFSEKQDASTWWMIAWGIIPIIPYFYFSYIHKSIYIPQDGLVELQKVKVAKQVKTKKGKKKKK